MPAPAELISAQGGMAQSRAGAVAFVSLGAAARWLGWLNAMGVLIELGFTLGVLGADIAPPDLTFPLALFLGGVLACGLAMLCWGVAQMGVGPRSAMLAGGLGALAYLLALFAFVAGCWLSVGVAVDIDSQVGAAYTVSAAPY
ncbi:hypothetical protein [Bordetella petrii]|uniref:hypothetical protein n=1 Tax=Bordetella petrii TaxID=94624 RepID=UPI001E33C4E0|nr:hypothetical protein [Bordetella petrii]MCD0505716.1 hypothetical protein [Bordetella petrii]